MLDDLGPSILGIGVYAASVQEALSHGWGLLESFGAAVLPSLAATVAAYPFIARISARSQQRQNHREHIVNRAVEPAIHILRNQFQTDALSQTLGYSNEQTSLQTEDTLRSIVRDTNEWRWLRQHEPEAGRLADRLEDARARFVETYAERKAQIAEEVREIDAADELGIQERTANQIAHSILQQVARREERMESHRFVNELHVNEYEHGTELVGRGVMFAQGGAEVVKAFTDSVSQIEESDAVTEAVADLRRKLSELREVEDELRQRFDRMAAERAPKGSCEICELPIIGRLR